MPEQKKSHVTFLACPLCGMTEQLQSSLDDVWRENERLRKTLKSFAAAIRNPEHEDNDMPNLTQEQIERVRQLSTQLHNPSAPHYEPPLADALEAMLALVERLPAIRRAGAMCANCCFNVSQMEAVDERAKKSMRESCEAWDAAEKVGT